MSLNSLCNTTITVYRPTTTATSMGGQTKTWAAVYSDIPASKQPSSGDTIEEANRRSLQISHTFYTPTEVVCLANDRVTEGGENYIVQWFEDQAGRGRVFAIHTLKKD